MALTNSKYNKLPQLSHIQGYWPLNEESGERADESDNGNDLTDNNTVLFGDGYIGNAADFEHDNNEYLTITDASQTGLDITGEISIAFHIRFETLDYGIVSKFDSAGDKRCYNVYAFIPGNKIRFLLTTDGTSASQIYVDNDTALSTVTWYHFVCTLNQTDDKIRIYKDGSLDCTPVAYTGNIADKDTPFTIGNHDQLYPADARIDEVIVWNKCLTAAEVLRVKNITGYAYAAFLINFI